MTNHPLRTWRQSRQISASALGVELGVTKWAVCDYERTRRFPGPSVLAAIERVTEGEISASQMLAAYQAAPTAPPPVATVDSSTSKTCCGGEA